MRTLLILCALLCIQVVSAQAETFAPAAPRPTPWLGVTIENQRNAPVVVEVVPDTPADIVGVRPGDSIISIEGKRIRTSDQLQRAIRSNEVGESIDLIVWRKGRSLSMRPSLTGILDPRELLQRRLVDKKAPDFSLEVIHGKAAGQLSKLRGKVVILEFWSTYCKSCRDSFEDLSNFRAEHLGEVEVLAITAESKSSIKRFLQGFQPALSILQDPRAEVHRAYRHQGSTMTVVVIGRDGTIRYADTGTRLSMADVLLSAGRAVRERAGI